MGNTVLQKTIIQLPHYGIIRISGNTAVDFLQGQLTCDMREINASTHCLTAYCNPQGRIWCIARIWQRDDDYYLHLPNEVLEPTMADLRKYGMFSKVTVAAQDNYSSVALMGTEVEVLAAFAPWIHLPTAAFLCHSTGELTALCIDIQRWLLIASTEFLTSLVLTLSKHDWQNGYSPEWNLLEIRAGIPSVWKETLTQLLPHDVNLTELNAVSFTKGCYKGQEIIARMQYRGQRKKHMYRASYVSNTHLLPGTAIVNEEQKNIGTVVCAAPVANGYELLAVLSDSTVAQKTAVFIHNQPLVLV